MTITQKPLVKFSPGSKKPGAVAAPREPRFSAAAQMRFRWLIVLMPTLLAIFYFTLLASNRYEAEAQIVVRTAAKPLMTGGFASIMQMTGISGSTDDVYSVQTFLTSREMVRQLEAKLPIRDVYAKGSWFDVIARYPSLIYGTSKEDFHRYLGWMISSTYLSSTGITTLSVQAFDPDDALNIAQELLDLAEHHVNSINQRIHDDAERVAREEVKHNEDRLLNSQTELTRFRNSELMLDAASSSLIITELIAKLSLEQTKVQAQMREIENGSSSNPHLETLKQRSAAIEEQITNERKKIAESDGLARKLAVYERLLLENEFSKSALALSVSALEQARNEARRQQLYLIRVVLPVRADESTKPESLRMIATILALNLVGALIAWLFWAGIREHSGPQ